MDRPSATSADPLAPLLRGVRAFCALAAGAMLLTIPLDPVRFPGFAATLLPARLACAALFAALLGVARTRAGRRHSHGMGLLAAAAGGAAVAVLAGASGGERSSQNANLIFVVLGVGVLVPWDAGWATLACGAACAAYAATFVALEGGAVGAGFVDSLYVVAAASVVAVATAAYRMKQRRQEQSHAAALAGAHRALLESEARLRAVVNDAPIVLFVLDPDGIMTMSEGRGLARLRLQPGALVGLHFREVVERLRPYRPEDEEHLRRALAGESVTWSTSLGETTFECRFSPIRDDTGAVTGVIGIALDVTVERRLLEAQKMESLGVLAAGVAHDFNNLLVSVLGNVSLAREQLPEDAAVQALLLRAETAARRGSELTRQMLAFAGKGDGAVEPVDVNAVVEEIRELLPLSLRKGVTTTVALAPDLPRVAGDATQMRQIVMNLLVNAAEGLGDAGGEIAVRTSVVELTAADLAAARHAPDAAPGPHVCLEVRDTGCGMDADTAARIFEPFFSTKFAGRGLGLATVLGAVRRHRGALTVASEPGEGTTFRILLPCAAPAPAVAAAPVEERAAARTVLLVDDEEEVRAVTADMLERLGCRVLLAGDGREGLDVFRAHVRVIDAVILDLTLPRLSGERAFREMQTIRPDAPVILMSGYSSEESARRLGEAQPAAFLKKPFTVTDLRATMARALAGDDQPRD